jgi:hypothetical protein
MQYQISRWRTQQRKATTNAPLLLAGLAALLITLALIGLWDTARAARQSGVNNPNLNIIGLNNNSITLAGQNWKASSTVALGYSTSTRCQPAIALKSPNNTAFVNDQGIFQLDYPWPSSITGGPFYFCASGRSSDNTPAPGIFTPQAIVVDAAGTVTFPPGSAPTPTATRTLPPTPTATHTPANAATATTQAAATATSTASATAQPAASATPNAPPTATASMQAGSPGNKGANASTPSSASILATFAAIVALCVLVFMLLIYLIRVWLHELRTP